MRITNSMLISDMLWNANNNLIQMSKKQSEMSSGKRIEKPSDDPVGTTQVLKYKTDIRVAEQYSENIRDVLGWLEVSESALMDVKDILQRIRELTVQAANGTNTEDDTEKIMTEVDELTDEIIVLGNSTLAGKYIFSGKETDEPLFNEDGTYNIDFTSERVTDKDNIAFEVSIGEQMDVSTNPIDIFGFVENDNFFKNIMVNSTATSEPATRATYAFNVDLTHDFTGDVLDITIDGTTYNVDESLMAQTVQDPLTKTEFINVLKDASDGTNKLSDVASIYFDQNDQLVIEAKTYGSATTITDSIASAGITSKTITPGLDGVADAVTTTAAITDADVLANNEMSTLVIGLGDQQKKIDIDFSGLTSVADLVTAVQTELDAQFPPAGTITVSGASGSALSFAVAGTNDGKTTTLKVDQIVGNQSKLISDLAFLSEALDTNNVEDLNTSLSNLDANIDKILTALGDIGGRTNRTEFIQSRIEENQITYTSLLSKVYDVDMAEAIMLYKSLESIYRASLSVGSKVIQPTLVDFIQ